MRNTSYGAKSVSDSSYTSGRYFNDPARHKEDASFKAKWFLELFLPFANRLKKPIRSYADVGCGSGAVVRILASSLRDAGYGLKIIKAYDVSPHVRDIRSDSVQFVHEDFSTADDYADLVTLFDVIEHLTDPIEFLKRVAARCGVLVFHIPLDNNFVNSIRDKFRALLSDPGHLLFLDSASALNLLALAGLKVVAYDYTFTFLAPSGRASSLSKLIFPVRWLLCTMSPWLMSKTLGGVGLMVIALTPRGLERYHRL